MEKEMTELEKAVEGYMCNYYPPDLYNIIYRAFKAGTEWQSGRNQEMKEEALSRLAYWEQEAERRGKLLSKKYTKKEVLQILWDYECRRLSNVDKPSVESWFEQVQNK